LFFILLLLAIKKQVTGRIANNINIFSMTSDLATIKWSRG
jgi:hypothetical protein